MAESKYDCLLTLSGGIDSTVLAHNITRDGWTPLCVYVDYGTRSKIGELRAARETCKDLNLDLKIIDFTVYKELSKAFILGNSEEYLEGSMFWLDGRNAIIGLMLSVLASSLEIDRVFLGINASDSDGDYLDTTDEFMWSLNGLVRKSCRHTVTVEAPWLDCNLTKSDVIELGNTYNLDWVRTTHSCSSGTEFPCCDYENCESCKYRQIDFAAVNLPDPFTKAQHG